MRIWDDPQLEAAHDDRKSARLRRYVRRMKRIYPGWGEGRTVSMREAIGWAARRGQVVVSYGTMVLW